MKNKTTKKTVRKTKPTRRDKELAKYQEKASEWEFFVADNLECLTYNVILAIILAIILTFIF